ncbi:MAG: leucine dehydrogenase [Actinomycetia bacterium]|nr:leucine dehydrogenase [Actinomycetes bacterium]
MGVFDAIGSEHHQSVHFGMDPTTGLRSIIAIHSTVLGPALGGTRFYPYETERDALQDVLRLSKGMTYKAACAGLRLGGGKAVIIGRPSEIGSDALFLAYGRFVESLGGQYITAEDVGTTVANMEIVATQTKYVRGLLVEHGGSGDPSPATAHGVAAAQRAVATMLWGSGDLAGKRIAIKGVGKVGMALVEILSGYGAELIVADVNTSATGAAAREYGAKVVDVHEIHHVECEIFAPCALGGDLNEQSIPELRCAAVVGSANNQLDVQDDGDRLRAAGILYAPDFVVNAGGIINIAAEEGGYSPEKADAMVERIFDNLTEILTTADRLGIGAHIAAEHVAEKRIAAAATMEA